MKKTLTGLMFILWVASAHAQAGAAKKEILDLLDQQTIAWNKGSIEDFMKGYWNNDSLMFVGKNGVVYGYQNTINRYKKSFPDTASMGKLSFDIISVQQLSPEYCFLVGKYTLNRTIGDLQGHFTLLFRKINGKWLAVCDQSN